MTEQRVPFLMPWELMDVSARNLWIADHLMNDWYEMVRTPGLDLGGLHSSMARRVEGPDAGSGQYEVRLIPRDYAQDTSAVAMFEAKIRSDGLWPDYVHSCIAVRMGQPGELLASSEEVDQLIAEFTAEERAHAAYLVARVHALNEGDGSS